jgi:hypothetical protein
VDLKADLRSGRHDEGKKHLSLPESNSVLSYFDCIFKLVVRVTKRRFSVTRLKMFRGSFHSF